MGLQEVTRGYRGLQRVTGVKGGVTGGFRGLEAVIGFTKVYKGLQGASRDYKGLQALQKVTRGHRQLQMVRDGYGGVTIGYRVVNNCNIKLLTWASRAQQNLISWLGIARQPRITI